MTKADVGAFPTLAQIRGWSASHLDAAADAWTARARGWESSYAVVAGQIWRPGDTPWQGAAADAAAQRVVADRRVVLGAADLLGSAAEAARAGGVEIRAARDVALQRVAAARRAQFDVQDDLSIVDVTPSSRGERRAVAERHARGIWNAADALVAADSRVARTITEVAKELQELWFVPMSDRDWEHDLLADYAGLVGPLSEAPHLVYCHPSARPDFWWCEGYDVGGGPYAFGSPFDASGVA